MMDKKPIQPKVKAGAVGGIGGAIVLAPLIVWVLKTMEIDMPLEVAAIVGGLLTQASSFISSFMKTE